MSVSWLDQRNGVGRICISAHGPIEKSNRTMSSLLFLLSVLLTFSAESLAFWKQYQYWNGEGEE